MTATKIASRYKRVDGEKLKAKHINDILEENGYITRVAVGNIPPTEKGVKIGGVKKVIPKGTFEIVYAEWSESAIQEFDKIFKSNGLVLNI